MSCSYYVEYHCQCFLLFKMTKNKNEDFEKTFLYFLIQYCVIIQSLPLVVKFMISL